MNLMLVLCVSLLQVTCRVDWTSGMSHQKIAGNRVSVTQEGENQEPSLRADTHNGANERSHPE